MLSAMDDRIIDACVLVCTLVVRRAKCSDDGRMNTDIPVTMLSSLLTMIHSSSYLRILRYQLLVPGVPRFQGRVCSWSQTGLACQVTTKLDFA